MSVSLGEPSVFIGVWALPNANTLDLMKVYVPRWMAFQKICLPAWMLASRMTQPD